MTWSAATRTYAPVATRGCHGAFEWQGFVPRYAALAAPEDRVSKLCKLDGNLCPALALPAAVALLGRPCSGSRQHVLQPLAPVWGQRPDPQGSPHTLQVALVEVRQVDELADRHPLRVRLDPLDDVARAHLALSEDPHIEADSLVGQEPLRKLGQAHLERELRARCPRLADLHHRPAHPKHVTEMHDVLKHPFHREVLAELPKPEVVTPEFALPVLVVLDAVGVGRFVNAAVGVQIRLPVPVQVQRAKHDPSGDRFLEDPGRDDPVVLADLLRFDDVDRE